MNGMKESEVLGMCIKYMRAAGIFCWRNNTGAYQNRTGRLVRYGLAGSSDILGICRDGRFLAVECKRENGGVVSESQREFLSSIKRNGGVAVTVRSVEELAAGLRENGVL